MEAAEPSALLAPGGSALLIPYQNDISENGYRKASFDQGY